MHNLELYMSDFFSRPKSFTFLLLYVVYLLMEFEINIIQICQYKYFLFKWPVFIVMILCIVLLILLKSCNWNLSQLFYDA